MARTRFDSYSRYLAVSARLGRRGLNPREFEALRHPPTLPVFARPFVLVTGPPASGKSTLVSERADADDLVVDLDTIALRIGASSSSLHDWDRAWLVPALEERNRLLVDAAMQKSAQSVWLIAGEPESAARDWWARRGAKVVVIEASESLCHDRIAKDAERQSRRAEQSEAVATWWNRYQRRVGDEIVVPPRPAARVALGIVASAVSDQLAANLKMDRPTGVFVASIAPGSVAYRAGLAKGDVILMVNGKINIAGPASLIQSIADVKSGQIFSIQIWRNGKAVTVELTF